MKWSFLALCWCAWSAFTDPVVDLQAKDRAVQRAGVEAFGVEDAGRVPELVALATGSERFDVRAHAIEGLARCGPSGWEALLRLATDFEFVDRDGHRELLVGALASGPDAVDMLEQRVVDGTGGGYLLRFVAVQAEVDLAAIGRRLLASGSVAARREGARYFLGDLPPSERGRAFVSLLSDPDRDVVTATATGWSQSRPWVGGVVGGVGVDDPIVSELVALATSQRAHVVGGAALALDLSGLRDVELSAALFDAARQPGLLRSDRRRALRAAVSTHPDPGQAVRLVAGLIGDHPEAVCAALSAAPVDAIPADVISLVVGLLPRTESSVGNPAQHMLAPADSVRRAALAPRVAGPLAASVRDGDDVTAGLAAETLERLGPAAHDAAPALIERLRRTTNDEHAERFARALIAVGMDDSGSETALTQLIARFSPPDDFFLPAGTALRLLRDGHADRDWVRTLVGRIAEDPGNRLRSFLRYGEPGHPGSSVTRMYGRLIAQMSEATSRDAAWAFAVANGSEPIDEKAITREEWQRVGAAGHLFWLENPDARVVGALASVIASPVLRLDRPATADRSVQPRDESVRRADVAARVWDAERKVAMAAATTLAEFIDGDDELTMLALFILDGHAFGTATLLSSEVWDERVLRTRPLRIPGHLVGITAPALLEQAADGNIFESEQQQGAIMALGRLQIDPAVRDPVLLDVVRFGAGVVGPPAAVAALGRSGPVSDVRLGFIRNHLRDPRSRVRTAAIRAAGDLGSDGAPLVDALFAMSSELSLWASEQHDIIGAVEKITPGDPRLRRLVRAREELQARLP
jgi:hypothetical protein